MSKAEKAIRTTRNSEFGKLKSKKTTLERYILKVRFLITCGSRGGPMPLHQFDQLIPVVPPSNNKTYHR